VTSAGQAQTGLVVTASAGQLTATWQDNNSTETGFRIERSRAGDVCEFAQLAALPAESVSYVDAGLTEGERWCYRVRAENDAGVSAYSNVACATVPTSGGGTQTASLTFTRTTLSTYTVPLGLYACQRLLGGTNRLQILKNGVLLSPTVKGPIPQPVTGAVFTVTCTLTPTAVTLALDGTVILTVAP
jgi:hypothetical protein